MGREGLSYIGFFFAALAKNSGSTSPSKLQNYGVAT
jgi:hypothetical protein